MAYIKKHSTTTLLNVRKTFTMVIFEHSQKNIQKYGSRGKSNICKI